VAVVAAINSGDLKLADRLNTGLRNRYRDSPRAQYNHACIYSRLAEQETGETRNELLWKARYRIRDALRFGILKFILLYGDRIDTRTSDPVEYILSDSDLRLYFDSFRDAADEIRKGIVRIGDCGC
jgi:hypothetical protein